MALVSASSMSVVPATPPDNLVESRTSPRWSGRQLLVPIEGKSQATLKTQSISAGDYLPDELLVALTQNHHPPEKLGPPTRLPNLNVSTVATRKAPQNVWTYAKQREKFKHLVSVPPCICGAGRDLSFLCDVSKKKESLPFKPDTFDASAVRATAMPADSSKTIQLPNTLIPEEYFIVKNKPVLGLECHDDEYGTVPEDHEKHLVVFPSMTPASRYEVMKLRQTLEDMLNKCGIHDEVDQLVAPTQMHQLLELIKKEQNIYNIIFHELIRQVSIECFERGELLATVRAHYADLLSKVPEQVKSLHDEVLAQRALDRRLTEELAKFKLTVSNLTSELNAVKEHDQQVTKHAMQVQEDLKAALNESSKNSNMLVEYRELYELQRRRLEKNVESLSEEMQTWCDVSYCLAGKVIEEHCLNSTRRLCVSERAWSRLGSHFAIALSDKDMADLMVVQSNVDGWRAAVDDFDRTVRSREEDVKHQLRMVIDDLHKWLKLAQKQTDSRAGSAKWQKMAEKFPTKKLNGLKADIKTWEQMLAYVSDKFGGESVLESQEALTDLRRFVSGWTNSALRIFLRRDVGAGGQHPSHIHMIHVNHEVDLLLKQYSNRVTGENGVIDGIQSVANGLEAWSGRLMAISGDAVSLPDQQKAVLLEQMEYWASTMSESVGNLGSLRQLDKGQQQDSAGKLEIVEKTDVLKHVHKWLKITHHAIDSEDAKIVEQVAVLHRKMVHWMTRALISLVPAHYRQSDEAKENEFERSISIEQLFDEAKTISIALTGFTKLLSKHCSHFVSVDRQTRVDSKDESTDHEQLELIRFTTESDDWIKMTSIVLNELSIANPIVMSVEDLDDKVENDKAETKDDVRSEHPVQEDTNLSEDHSEEKQPSISQDLRYSASSQKDDKDAAVFDGDEQSFMALNKSQSDLAAVADDGGTHHEWQDADGSDAVPSTSDNNLTDSFDVCPPAQETIAESDMPIKESLHGTTLVDSGVNLQPPSDDLEVIGYDASTRTVDLSEPSVSNDQSDQARPASGYTAFASVKFLQEQLMSSETRAQEAEERAVAAETALVEALERLRFLERDQTSVTPAETPLPPATPSETSQSRINPLPKTPASVSSTASASREKSVHRTSSTKS